MDRKQKIKSPLYYLPSQLMLCAVATLGTLSVTLAAQAQSPTDTPVLTKSPAKQKTPGYTAAKDNFHVVRPGEYTSYNQRQRLARHGQVVYNNQCAGCHGINGDGQGPAAKRLLVKPRDFTKGVFKFRSTKQLQLPMESDLHRTITRGLPGASMPAFPLMPEPDKVAVIEYIKTFVPNWEQLAKERQVVYVPQAPNDLEDSNRIMRGRVVYLSMQCARCHGTDGAGTKASIGYVNDDALGKIRPRNFTYGRFRGGTEPESVYRTFHTGLGGAMPKFDDSLIVFANQGTVKGLVGLLADGELNQLKPYLDQFPKSPAEVFKWTDIEKRQRVEQNSWDLVAYVLSLTKSPKRTAPPPVQAVGDDDDSNSDDQADGENDEY